MKGATDLAGLDGLGGAISIHAPVKGATGPPFWLPAAIRYFNPRSREGSDVVPLHRLLPRQNFNPRSREGSDGRLMTAAPVTSRFQSTLP